MKLMMQKPSAFLRSRKILFTNITKTTERLDMPVPVKDIFISRSQQSLNKGFNHMHSAIAALYRLKHACIYCKNANVFVTVTPVIFD